MDRLQSSPGKKKGGGGEWKYAVGVVGELQTFLAVSSTVVHITFGGGVEIPELLICRKVISGYNVQLVGHKEWN